jgi:hypothetical protein
LGIISDQKYLDGHTFEVTHVLSIGPLLTVQLQIPSQSILEKLLIRIVREVELFVLITLPIGGAVHRKLNVVTSRDEHTSDNGVVGFAEDSQRSEEVLPRGLKSVEEASNLVGRHENEGQLVVVLEVTSPHGERFLVVAEERLVPPYGPRRIPTHFS